MIKVFGSFCIEWMEWRLFAQKQMHDSSLSFLGLKCTPSFKWLFVVFQIDLEMTMTLMVWRLPSASKDWAENEERHSWQSITGLWTRCRSVFPLILVSHDVLLHLFWAKKWNERMRTVWGQRQLVIPGDKFEQQREGKVHKPRGSWDHRT